MATGRCSGCGRTDSLRKISTHIVDCFAYLDLFQRDPARALGPAAEYERYRAEDRSPEARAEQRGERLQVRFAEINRQQAVSASRWAKPPDILD
jgi:hypothetical protein